MNIDNTQEVIDSRDVIERIKELQGSVDAQDELDSLLNLQEQAESSPDWEHGEGLIREDFFTEYCEDLCRDIGEIPHDLPWYIESHIDWTGVAREIAMDYIMVDFDGVVYYIRA